MTVCAFHKQRAVLTREVGRVEPHVLKGEDIPYDHDTVVIEMGHEPE